MKCPYRKTTNHSYVLAKEGTDFLDASYVEEFVDCYYDECPFYYFNYDKKEHECMKAQKEVLIDAK